MRRFVSLALLLGGLWASGGSPDPGRVMNVAAPGSPTAAIDPRLRSAFLVRATGSDRIPRPMTAAQIQHELRAHFDAVLEILVRNTDRALQASLDRLESRLGVSWTPSERAIHRQRLAVERRLNIDRLRAYQSRGLFPINEHVSGGATPIFVDSRDTACAVGHLMRESGWTMEVVDIEATNNLVYITDVSDVSDGPIVEWVARSGLTWEEAALIQPGYAPQPEAWNSLTDALAGTPLAAHPWTYSNFTFSATGASAATDGWISTGRLGAAYSPAPIVSPVNPAGSWLIVSPLAHTASTPFTAQLQFDVATDHPQYRINRVTLVHVAAITSLSWGSILNGPTASVAALAEVSDGGVVLDTAQVLSNQTKGPFGSDYYDRDDATFDPRRSVHVKLTTEVTAFPAPDGLVAFGFAFQVVAVPEPAAAHQSWLPLVVLGVLVRRRVLA